MRAQVLRWSTAVLAVIAIPALASAQVMDFEGIADSSPVGDFYNGNGGPDLDIEFGGNTLALIDLDAGGGGNFANEPSPNTIMFFLVGSGIMNHVGGGFETGFSFWYTSMTAADVNIWSGLNATGILLGTIGLTANHNVGCSGDPSGDFCNWDPIGVEFDGLAQSVDFGGTVGQTGYDDITLRSSTPGTSTTPEPMSLILMASGLAGLAAVGRRRRSLQIV